MARRWRMDEQADTHSEELRLRAHHDAWEWLIQEPKRAILMALLVFAITGASTLITQGSGEFQTWLVSGVIRTASVAVTYLIMFVVNYFYLTPTITRSSMLIVNSPIQLTSCDFAKLRVSVMR